ncbi:MAG TPA: phosphoribosylglycinamide formyltransferase [Coriobacteriia bacterium]
MLIERKMRLGVLISGSGTNLQALLDASAAGELDADVVVVISNHQAALGLERARGAGVPAVMIDPAVHDSARAYNHAILETLQAHEVDVVVMAGYMRLLGSEVLQAYPDRVVNIHPALLPSFAGANGIRDAFDYGVKVTGVTVHFATEEFDAGPIIAQEAVRIEQYDTPETLEAKIHEVEHRIYPAALQLMAEGRLRVEGRRVRVLT